jgi:pyridoxine 5-phosphate synthase
MNNFLKLGVNIDHVATLRQARYARMPGSPMAEPDVIAAGQVALDGGADSLTLHLRADRRHIQDDDVWRVKKELSCLLNLEMGNDPGIVTTALELRPDFVCLVPEKREEITTEGGLDLLSREEEFHELVKQLQGSGIKVSLFLDPHEAHMEAAARIGAEMVELHTGSFANAAGASRLAEIDRLRRAALLGHSLGLQMNAGHGLTTANLPELFCVPHLVELNIGHHLISRSIFIGLKAAVEEMVVVMRGYGEVL